jgi:hypothetical protein
MHRLAEPFRALDVDTCVVESVDPVVDGLGVNQVGRRLCLSGPEFPALAVVSPREEGDVGAGRPLAVAEVEVIGAGVVVVDGALDESQPEGLRIELRVAFGVTGDSGDVVNAGGLKCHAQL